MEILTNIFNELNININFFTQNKIYKMKNDKHLGGKTGTIYMQQLPVFLYGPGRRSFKKGSKNI